ncbi:MAG: creatininase family protein [Halobacteriales archaeon]
MHLAETTWPDAADVDTDLAVLPVGSTEQHGPHAPLSTDTLSAAAVAEAGADAYDDEVVVAPALPYGISKEHRHFSGTLWLSPDTFRDAVRDVIESLTHHGWDRVVIVNGHGGNTDALREVAASVSREGTAYAAAFTWFDAVDPEDVGDAPDPDEMGHAGSVETSVVMHHAPHLLRENRFEEAADGASDGWGEWVSGVNLAYDSAAFTENGVIGDPSTATAKRGTKLTAEAGDALADLFEAIAGRDVSSER